MPPHIRRLNPPSFVRSQPPLCLRYAKRYLKPISTTPSRLAEGMSADLAELLSPLKTKPPTIKPLLSKPESQPPASSSASLLPTEDEVPAESQASPDSGARGSAALTQILRRNLPRTSNSVQRQADAAARTKHASSVENQMSRVWREGDIYAPHDLSPAEMRKARAARFGNSSNKLPTSRRKVSKDAIDRLGIKPLAEYKNVAMMSGFVSHMGRIMHSSTTGLRAVNQRKMAKAVRRSIGIGLMPSVHRHPELHGERMTQRGQSAAVRGLEV